MNHRDYFTAVVGALVIALTGCSTLPDRVSQENSGIPKQMLARQVLVTVPGQYKAQWPAIRQEFTRKHALIETGEFPLDAIGVDCLVYQVPTGQAISRVIRQLQSDKRVTLAQENQVFEGIQSGESDAFAEISYGPKLIHADAAHRISTGKGVKIAIIDTGAEKEHPDLKGRVQATANFVEGGDRTFSRDTHGTAVAGVIGARANDGTGIYGIAPDADISVYKACWYPDSGGKAQCSSWSLAKAMNAAITSGTKIINLSLAGPHDDLLETMLSTAHERKINIVAAALENQAQPGFPAELPYVIPVISAGPDGKPAQPAWLKNFSGTVAAPGVEVLTTVPNDGYDFVSGSSLATAHISGIIALMLELKPGLTPQNIKNLLIYKGIAGSPPAPMTVDACAILGQLGKGGAC